MRNLVETPENVKVDLAVTLDDAVQTRDACPQFHSQFDREDFDGTLWHDGEHCPYCAVRHARQAYFTHLRKSSLERARRIEVWTTSKDYKQSSDKDRLLSHARATRARARDHMRAYDDMTPRQQVEANVALELAELEYEALWVGHVRDPLCEPQSEINRLRAEREAADNEFDGQGVEDADADLWWVENKARENFFRLHPSLIGVACYDPQH